MKHTLGITCGPATRCGVWHRDGACARTETSGMIVRYESNARRIGLGTIAKGSRVEEPGVYWSVAQRQNEILDEWDTLTPLRTRNG
jgi:hypothetical protein